MLTGVLGAVNSALKPVDWDVSPSSESKSTTAARFCLPSYVKILEPGGEAMGEVVCVGYGSGIGPEYGGAVFQSK